MPQSLPEPRIAMVVLAILVYTLGAAVLGAWFWALRRWWSGRPLLAGDPPDTAAGSLGRGRWSPGVALLALATFLLAQIVVGIVFFGAAALMAGPQGGRIRGVDPSAVPPGALIHLATIANVGVVLIVGGLLRRKVGLTPADLGLTPPRVLWRDIRAGLIAFLMLAPLVYACYALAMRLWAPRAHPVFQSIRSNLDAASASMAVLSAVIAAPLAEELVFRGALLCTLAASAFRRRAGGWATLAPLGVDPPDPEFAPETWPAKPGAEPPRPRNLDFWVANAVVSAMFAGIHVTEWPSPIPLFVLAMGLGWLTWRTGRLVAAVTLHAVFNAFAMVVSILTVLASA
jgi:membrane protease YdiL (CAAX protease family)